MRRSLLRHLACPSCGGEFGLADSEAESQGAEICAGTLRCSLCGASYPVVRGVPRLNTAMSQLEDVARTFDYEWKAHHRGELEKETVFGRTPAEDWRYLLDGFGVSEEALDDSLILDAGCGSASLTLQMGRRPGSEVIGVDLSDAVDEAHGASSTQPNVHIVQANIFALPFRPGTFDFVWSNGVIHHTPDAQRAFHALAASVAPAGRLYVWVYAKRFNPFRLVKDVFDLLHISHLPERALLSISATLSYTSWGMLQVYRAIRRLPGLRPRGAWGKRTVRQRTIAELTLTWFDALSPAFNSRHTEGEVIGWFKRAGFEDISAIEEPKVGVRGIAPRGTAASGGRASRPDHQLRTASCSDAPASSPAASSHAT